MIQNKDRSAPLSFYSSRWEQYPLLGFVVFFKLYFVMLCHAIMHVFFNYSGASLVLRLRWSCTVLRSKNGGCLTGAEHGADTRRSLPECTRNTCWHSATCGIVITITSIILFLWSAEASMVIKTGIWLTAHPSYTCCSVAEPVLNQGIQNSD